MTDGELRSTTIESLGLDNLLCDVHTTFLFFWLFKVLNTQSWPSFEMRIVLFTIESQPTTCWIRWNVKHNLSILWKIQTGKYKPSHQVSCTNTEVFKVSENKNGQAALIPPNYGSQKSRSLHWSTNVVGLSWLPLNFDFVLLQFVSCQLKTGQLWIQWNRLDKLTTI